MSSAAVGVSVRRAPAALFLALAFAAAADVDALDVLTPGQTLQRELPRGAGDRVRLDLPAGQLVHAIIEPDGGASLTATLIDPSAAVIARADDPGGGDTPLRLYAVSGDSGAYQLCVSARAGTHDEGARGPARFRLRLDPLRAATEHDVSYVAADRAQAEAAALAAQGTGAALGQALQGYLDVRDRWHGLREVGREADAWNEIGVLRFQLGSAAQARPALERAAALYETVDDRRGLAESLNNLGSVLRALGELERAVDYYQRAEPLLAELGLTRLQAVLLNNVGTVYKDRGDPRRAIELYLRALPLRQEVGDLRGQALTLTNIGVARRMLGERDRALFAYEEALPLARAADDARTESLVLQNLGALSLTVGDTERARDALQRALELSRRAGDRGGEAFVLAELGVGQRLVGDLAQARQLLEQALALRRAQGDRYWEATTLLQLGAVHRLAGEATAAREALLAALVQQRDLGDRSGEIHSLLELVALAQGSGDPAAARGPLDEALAASRALGDPAAEATALYRLARQQRAEQDLEGARRSVEAAVALQESLRARVAGAESRASFFSSSQDIYEFQIDLLMEMARSSGGNEEVTSALEASERKRARSLLDALADSRAEIGGGLDPDLRRKEWQAGDRLRAATQRQAQLMSGKHGDDVMAAARGEIDRLAGEYQEVQARLQAMSPSYAAFLQGAVASASEIQALLDEDTLLLELSLGEKASHGWAVTRERIEGAVLPSRREITAAAWTVLDGIDRTRNAPAAQGNAGAAARRELSRMLLGPFAAHLGHRRLAIVADGILQHVPYAALPDPRVPGTARLLVASHAIVVLPSASILKVLRMPAAPSVRPARQVAVLADPVFEHDDPRVGPAAARPRPGRRHEGDLLRSAAAVGLLTPAGALSRLPFSREEAASIAAVAGSRSVFRALDFEASRKTALSPILRDFRIVHFATHAVIDNEHPDRSGIVLSLVDRQGAPQDGFLRLRDVYDLRWPADLVVLSACRTALGKEVRGEGLASLVRGFMYGGVPRVVASLWSVDDRATAVLMREFYRSLLERRLAPSEALRHAQLAVQARPQWRAPFYWAGFVLEGEWR